MIQDRRTGSQQVPEDLDSLVGQNVVLDYPANTKAVRAWLRTLFEPARAAHVLHFLDAPDSLCLQRIARRNAELPEGSHYLTPEVFAYVSSFFEAPEAAEGFTVELHREDNA